MIRRHRLVAFFVIAFVLTWVTVPFGVFMAAGPLVAALIVISVVDGRPGLRELKSRMLRWRVGARWYGAAILIPLGVALAAGGMNVALGASDGAFGRLELSALVLMFALRLVVPVFAPVGEEPGWRGYALPHLQRRHSPVVATLILGVVVAVWHVPLVFLAEEHFSPIFLVATVAVTFFYTWIFNHTRGSVFMTIVAHAAEGVLAAAFVGKDGFAGAGETRFAILYTARMVRGRHRPRRLRPQDVAPLGQRVTDDAPRSAADAVERHRAFGGDGLLLFEGESVEGFGEFFGDAGELGVGVGVVRRPDDAFGADER